MYVLCMKYVFRHTCHSTCLKVRGQLLVEVSSFLLPHESQGSYSVCQAWHLHPLNHLIGRSFSSPFFCVLRTQPKSLSMLSKNSCIELHRQAGTLPLTSASVGRDDKCAPHGQRAACFVSVGTLMSPSKRLQSTRSKGDGDSSGNKESEKWIL